ncbi:MAG: hypothetical protein ABFD08_17310 [Syntrophomonas sp.]
MKKRLVSLLVLSLLLAFTAMAQAAGYTDTIQTPTNYFVPTDAQKYDSPYYRWNGQDWGWTHGAIAGSINSATLNISAFDVDYESWSSYYSGERDAVYAYDNGVKTFLGYLAGGNDIWSYTTFTLGSNFYDDINAGLQVWFEIDTTDEGWAVTLTKSALSIDGGELPGPQPGAVPIPGAVLLFAPGLAGLAVIRKKMNL